MTTYTTNEAQKDLDRLLEEASRAGSVEILRANGQSYVIRPVKRQGGRSDLDVPTITTSATTDDIRAAVRESRESRH